MLDRPERETLEAKDARMIAATRKQVRKRGSTQFFDHRTILLCRLLDAAEAERDAALAAAPDARLAEALAEAKMLMGNEHVSWQGTAARLFEIIERLAAAREGTRSGGDTG
jgi:hypothetical protein